MHECMMTDLFFLKPYHDRLAGGAQKQAASKWLASTFSSSWEMPEEALAALGACTNKTQINQSRCGSPTTQSLVVCPDLRTHTSTPTTHIINAIYHQPPP